MNKKKQECLLMLLNCERHNEVCIIYLEFLSCL